MRIKSNYFLIFFFGLLLIFINSEIILKNKILKNGEQIYFKLAPVDPRAFMLGDYMTLRFTPSLNNYSDQNMTSFVVTLDKNNVVTDAVAYQGQALESNQRIFRVQDQLRPNRFYFQEGHATTYDQAKYGVFRYLSSNQFLLEKMADQQLKILDPNT